MTDDFKNTKSSKTISLGLPLFLLTAIFFLNFTLRIILAPLMPTLLTDMNLSPEQAGSFFLISASGYFISLTLSGVVSSKLKHKKTILLSAVASGLAIICTGWSQNLVTLRMGIFAVGLASGLYLPSGIAILTSLVSRNNWGKALGIHEMAPNISFLSAPLICEGLLLWVSWRSILVIAGVVCIGFGIFFYTFSTAKDFPGEAPVIKALRPMVSKPSFWTMIVLFSLGVTGTLGVYAMLPLYLVKAHGMVQTEANTLITLSRVLTLPMCLFIGCLTDRLGVKSTLTGILCLTGILTSLIGILTGLSMKIVIFFQPLFAVCFFPPAFAALSQLYEEDSRSVAISFTIPLAFLLGGGVIPNIMGILGDGGYFSAGFIIFGALIFAGAVLPLMLKTLRV